MNNVMKTMLMPFLDESESFVHGFEVGTLWERMKTGETIQQQPVHSENHEQIKLMCDHFGYEYELQDVWAGWSSFKAKPIDVSQVFDTTNKK